MDDYLKQYIKVALEESQNMNIEEELFPAA